MFGLPWDTLYVSYRYVSNVLVKPMALDLKENTVDVKKSKVVSEF